MRAHKLQTAELALQRQYKCTNLDNILSAVSDVF